VLSRLDINNFQSLKDVHLDLGLLTVIVGDSNCGKSATIRALQALASNARGSSFVTLGQKAASVSASSDDFKVTLEKSEGSSSYKLSSLASPEVSYTKLAGDVPKEITDILGLEPIREGSSINFAGQHDSPFLLTDSGSSVARTLGDLTNVIVVFEAVREANRIRTSANSDLRLRSKDLEENSAQLVELDSLKTRAEHLKSAEECISEVKGLEIDVAGIAVMQDRLKQLENLPEVRDEVDIRELLESYEDINRLIDLLKRMSKLKATTQEMDVQWSQLTELSGSLDTQLQQLVEELGTCPLCQQDVIR
jgi:DNA repair protein SbcC/Rad50